MKAPGVAGQGARARGWLFLLFLVLTLVVINGAQWFVLSRAKTSLEEVLGIRLMTVATVAVSAAIPDLLQDPDVQEDPFVRGTLAEIAAANDLSDVFLVDRAGVVVFDLDDTGVGEVNLFQEFDEEAFQRAIGGAPSASRLVELGGEFLKVAYAPIRDPDGRVTAVLGVTAGTEFHQRLPALRRFAWGVSIGSAALVALLSVIFFGMLRRLSVTEAALAHAETLGAMGLMAAGVAHEIRNPLAIITGTAQRLRKKYGGDPVRDELFDYIPEEVERLNGILEGYLRFAREDPLVFVECDPQDLVQRSCGMIRDEFAERGVEVEMHLEPVPAIRADPLRLRQVLLNLLLNSVQAMPEGGRITVRLATDDRAVNFVVEDTGSGFQGRALRGAFQPFFTTKEKGSGLGLVVVKRIVEAHGGTISLANRRNGGAVVTVRVPAGAPPPGPREEG